jgi:hypothetical protein
MLEKVLVVTMFVFLVFQYGIVNVLRSLVYMMITALALLVTGIFLYPEIGKLATGFVLGMLFLIAMWFLPSPKPKPKKVE